MDKQILQSTRALPDTSNYAVAMYHDRELHITPLRGIVHLRPSFPYLDKSDKRAKEEAKDQGDGKQSRNYIPDSSVIIINEQTEEPVEEYCLLRCAAM